MDKAVLDRLLYHLLPAYKSAAAGSYACNMPYAQIRI